MPHPRAFTSKQVSRLSGLSARVLKYWEDTGVYAATYIADRPRVPYRRIYSFRDLVSLRTLAMLRRQHGVRLDDLRQAGAYLRDSYPEVDNPWSELRFGVLNRRVVFREPSTGEWRSAAPPQHILPIDVAWIARTTATEAEALLARRAEDVGQVVRHRHVLRNAWRLAGTRIPTAAVWRFYDDGSDIDEIRREYPDLEVADVLAAIQHERKLRNERTA